MLSPDQNQNGFGEYLLKRKLYIVEAKKLVLRDLGFFPCVRKFQVSAKQYVPEYGIFHKDP